MSAKMPETTAALIVRDLFDEMDRESQDIAIQDIERFYSPEQLAAEFRSIEPILEGFCLAAEQIGPAALTVMHDCRERLRAALAMAEEAAGQETNCKAH